MFVRKANVVSMHVHLNVWLCVVVSEKERLCLRERGKRRVCVCVRVWACGCVSEKRGNKG